MLTFIVSDYSIRYVEPELDKRPWSKRTQLLIDEYDKISKERLPKTIGRSREFILQYEVQSLDWAERVWDERVRLRSKTEKIDIMAIYRCRRQSDKKEFYFYNAIKPCLTANNQPEFFKIENAGYHVVPVVRIVFNQEKAVHEPGHGL